MTIPSYMTLERAIANYMNNRTKENFSVVQKLLPLSSFIVCTDPKAVSKKDPVLMARMALRAEKGDLKDFPVLLLKSELEERPFVPVFTNPKEAESCRFAAESAGIKLNFSGLLQLLSQIRNAAGYVVINPESESIAFDIQDFLKVFGSYSFKVEQEELKQGDVLTFENLRLDTDQDALEILARSCRQYPEISRVWAARQIKDGEFYRLMIVIESDLQREDGHQHAAAPFIGHLKKNAAVVYAGNPAAADLIQAFAPAYTRN